MERIAVVKTKVKYIPESERMNAMIRRMMKMESCNESFRTSFLSVCGFITFCIFCEVKKPKIIPKLIISTTRMRTGVKRKIYLILSLNTTFKVMNERTVNTLAESKDNDESLTNSFFLPLKNHVVKTMKRKTNKNIPVRASN